MSRLPCCYKGHSHKIKYAFSYMPCGNNNCSRKVKHYWNTGKFCRLTDAFKGVLPSL